MRGCVSAYLFHAYLFHGNESMSFFLGGGVVDFIFNFSFSELLTHPESLLFIVHLI